MAYYLRQDKKKKGLYLQMYESFWDKEKKQPRSRNIESFGYVSELISDEIPDPVSYYQKYVAEKNREHAASVADETHPRVFATQLEKNIGYFLVDSLLSELNVKETVDILALQKRFQFNLYDMIAQLIYARILYPCSKSKTVSTVFPRLYHSVPISEDQVYDGCAFIGESYKKYIELFNHCYEEHYRRDFSSVFFDCTNYYFEIDLPKEDKQKGPSKENRHEPIIGQALLLDADLVPLAMQMYPGNESEKPYIRKIIQEMKERYKVTGKTVQVADKGLNCARNIYAAVIEARDGYIFSKSVHGKGLSEKEKQWLLLENDANVYTDYRDKNGKLLFRLKSCVDTFSYKFKELNPETGEEKVISFRVKEKRIVSYNPSLAQKQKAEIMKMVDKATNYTTYKKMAREDLGDSVKYIQITNKSNGIPACSKIEESFRITKSYLDARPVYVQKKETIYGHFLICYLSLFLLKILEIKCFKNKINSYDLVNFMRDFRVIDKGDGTYINISQNQSVNEKIKNLIGLTNLDALYLTEKEIENIFEFTMLIDN